MLTLEFKCFPSPEQQEKIEKWLQISKSVWNCGLSALENFETNYYYYKATNGSNDKVSGGYAPCCRLPWEYWSHFIDENKTIVSKDKGKSTIQAPYSRIYDDKSHWYIRELKRVKVPQPAERKESWGWQNSEHSLVTGYSCPLSVLSIPNRYLGSFQTFRESFFRLEVSNSCSALVSAEKFDTSILISTDSRINRFVQNLD